MHKTAVWVQDVLVPALGPWGLFVVAFFDSSFLSLPEINDILLVTSSAAEPRRAWLFMVMATAGSVAGCALLWFIGRRGGEALLSRRFGTERVEKTRLTFQRWDWLTLAVPALLPPPMPFKIFVLSAGVFRFPLSRLIVTLTLARGFRYLVWGLLGIYYGERALLLLKQLDHWLRDYGVLFLIVTVAIGAVLVFVWWRKRRRASHGGRLL